MSDAQQGLSARPFTARPCQPDGMDRTHTDVTDQNEAGSSALWMSPVRCRQLLAATRVSRVAFVQDGLPRLVVLNHMVDGEAVVFQTSEETRLAHLTTDGAEVPVTIEIDSAAASKRTGWSIVASGRLRRTDETESPRHPTPWRSGARGVLLRLEVDDIHGQMVGTSAEV